MVLSERVDGALVPLTPGMTLRMTGNSTLRTDRSGIEAAVQTIERTITVPTPQENA